MRGLLQILLAWSCAFAGYVLLQHGYGHPAEAGGVIDPVGIHQVDQLTASQGSPFELADEGHSSPQTPAEDAPGDDESPDDDFEEDDRAVTARESTSYGPALEWIPVARRDIGSSGGIPRELYRPPRA